MKLKNKFRLAWFLFKLWFKSSFLANAIVFLLITVGSLIVGFKFYFLDNFLLAVIFWFMALIMLVQLFFGEKLMLLVNNYFSR